MELDIFQKTDMDGQAKAKKYLNKIFNERGYDLEYEQHYQDKGGIDIFMIAKKNDKIVRKYAVEAKDRSFHVEKYEDLIIEKDKYNKLIEESKKGYYPIYLNTFTNGCAIWNLLKCIIYDMGEIECKRKTLLNLPKEKLHKYGVKKSEAEIIIIDNK